MVPDGRHLAHPSQLRVFKDDMQFYYLFTHDIIKDYANVIMHAKKENDKHQKVDYSKLNREFG